MQGVGFPVKIEIFEGNFNIHVRCWYAVVQADLKLSCAVVANFSHYCLLQVY